ncbi:MAG: glycoside hydrolase family 9 protein [Oscillospiraceae bacterium]|nr:glycoside hydrolase family 9 protein [Oscillospiraceae bacterium]
MRTHQKVLAAVLAAGLLISTLSGCKNQSVEDSSQQSETSSGESVSVASGKNSVTSESKPADSADNNVSTDNPDSGNSGVSSGVSDVQSVAELSMTGNGYEGEEGTGDFNYGEALQKSLLFYELQRSGDLDESTIRTNWRGDSGMNDGSDAGIDLTGGLYDAGDNVKFNLPMAYTATMLAWSVFEDKDAYEKSGQLEYALGNIKWICDYLIKCHPEDNVYYYQVGDGNADHAWWGPCEVMQMNRPSYKVDENNPGSAVVGEAAAALAACAAVYKDIDKEYSEKCLAHAKQLYEFADSTKSDAGYTAANGFYNSWSGFYDELTWAALWLNEATGDNSWLDKAKEYMPQCDANPKWALCWDNKSIGALCLLAKLTGDNTYKSQLEECLDWWSGNGGESITYSPKGLAWLDQWGSLRYATTMAMVAESYAESDACPKDKAKVYSDFCEKQINYALGSTGRSFVVGFGENPPEHPHHRTAQGSWADNMNEPSNHRHTLFGALVGGPNASDGYTDTVSDYTANEVACDYNAGFTGALAKMYKKYGGQTLKDFGAVEPVGEEMFVEQKINATGDGFTEIKALVYNESGWPARVGKDLELRYFVDLSELSDPSAVTVSLNYGEGVKFGGIYEWDKDNGIYYVSLDFSDSLIYPGGQSAYKKEVQFRMAASGWNPENDPSYAELKGTNGSDLIRAENVGLYENGKLIFGKEPDGSLASTSPVKPAETSSASSVSSEPQTSTTKPSGGSPTVEKGGIKVSLNQQQASGSASTIGFNIDIANNSGSAIDLSGLEIDYFFTADGKSGLECECDHAAVNGSGYTAVTDKVKSAFESLSGDNCDTKCAVTFSGGTLNRGDTLTLQLRIHASDWSNFDLGNDWSAGNAGHILVLQNGSELSGSKP